MIFEHGNGGVDSDTHRSSNQVFESVTLGCVTQPLVGDKSRHTKRIAGAEPAHSLSPIDARFACICGGTSKQHPTTRGCEHCKECDYYRPAKSWRLGKVCEFSDYRLGGGWQDIVCPLCRRQTTVTSNGRITKHKAHIESHNRGRCYHVDADGVSRRCRVDPPTASERFAKFVDQTDECWLWTGARERGGTGYGLFRIGDRQLKAHRYAWEMENGPIPEGMIVCHHCDVRHCVRLDHLFLGTTLDNIRDKQNKGRQPNGTDIPTSKLTPEQVLEIRRAYPSVTLAALGTKYGVTSQSISAIVTGKSWRHLA